MVIQAAGVAPYAPSKAIVDVIQRYRDRDIPQPLTVESLHRISVSESLAPRVLQALKLLELVNDEGRVTPRFKELKKVATSDFKPAVVDILRSAYAEVFAIVDPANAAYEQVRDAFRTFKPAGQRDRMVSLFLGLLEFAEYSETLPQARLSRATQASHTGIPSPPKATRASNSSDVHKQSLSAEQTPRAQNATCTTVLLGTAGSVTLVLDVNLLELRGEDRNFVLDLVDRIQDYQGRSQLCSESRAGHLPDSTAGGTPS